MFTMFYRHMKFSIGDSGHEEKVLDGVKVFVFLFLYGFVHVFSFSMYMKIASPLFTLKLYSSGLNPGI